MDHNVVVFHDYRSGLKDKHCFFGINFLIPGYLRIETKFHTSIKLFNSTLLIKGKTFTFSKKVRK